MAKARVKSEKDIPKSRAAWDPEAREQQLIAYATNEAEKRIRDGSASDTLLCHYLKLGSSKALLEKEKLQHENKLMEAKTDSLHAQQHAEELFSQVMKSMKIYQGDSGLDDEEVDDEY